VGNEQVNRKQPEGDAIDAVEPSAVPDESTPDAAGEAMEVADADAESAATESAESAEAATEEQASVDVMALLGSHVPLALLADLAQPEGPASPTILKDEGLPDVPWWE
jgi:hypothetical protein